MGFSEAKISENRSVKSRQKNNLYIITDKPKNNNKKK